ncbi:MAG TPA: hypothetical protein VIT92_17320 [Burkholderiaceae bacterium]
MSSNDIARQSTNLAFLASGAEFAFGDPAGLPLPAAQLAALTPASPGVEAVMQSGLTAVVYKLRVDERCYAVKQARPRCLVRNADGQTSFLNELQRHAELAALRAQDVVFPGVLAPLYGSLRHGVIVSPWIAGAPVDTFDRRRIRQLLATGSSLLAHGFFEWDFSPGNLLDDGAQTWIFDFGYMYRYDPLRELNSAGNGRDAPQFHLAERIETRAAFAWLLRIGQEQGMDVALERYAVLKEEAAASYAALRAQLAARGADALVLAHYEAIVREWDEGTLPRLYLKEAWRSHTLDLYDDLHGKTCTPTTLARADWLLEAAFTQHAQLLALGALSADDSRLSRDDLLARYRGHRASAERYQLPAPAAG